MCDDRDLLKGSSFQIGTEKGETPMTFSWVTLVVNLHPRIRQSVIDRKKSLSQPSVIQKCKPVNISYIHDVCL